MYYIYRTTNLINGKTYIGQHETSDMLNDFYIGSGKLIKRAIKKYGKENFKNEILEVVLSRFEANYMEKMYISKERSIGKAEYNIADGGSGSSGHHRTEEAKKRMSSVKKGENNPFYGKSHTDDYKVMMHNKFSGENNPMFGKVTKGAFQKGHIPWNKGKKLK